jgi:hypothetical protein
MTLDAFIAKYNNFPIDFDGYFGNQCMDLYRQYVQEALGFPQSPLVPGAADVWDTFLGAYYDRIVNTPTAVPEKGDIIIWRRAGGLPDGHIALLVSGDISTFMSFDQNWPSGSHCHHQNHNYTNVLGWLRPNVPPSFSSDQVLLNQIMAVASGPGDAQSKLQQIRVLLQ